MSKKKCVAFETSFVLVMRSRTVWPATFCVNVCENDVHTEPLPELFYRRQRNPQNTSWPRVISELLPECPAWRTHIRMPPHT